MRLVAPDISTLRFFPHNCKYYFSTSIPPLWYSLAVATLEEKRAAVQKSLLTRRQNLVNQGLCRDCGLNPIDKGKARVGGKRKPTLCKECKEQRRTREADRRARLTPAVE